MHAAKLDPVAKNRSWSTDISSRAWLTLAGCWHGTSQNEAHWSTINPAIEAAKQTSLLWLAQIFQHRLQDCREGVWEPCLLQDNIASRTEQMRLSAGTRHATVRQDAKRTCLLYSPQLRQEVASCSISLRIRKCSANEGGLHTSTSVSKIQCKFWRSFIDSLVSAFHLWCELFNWYKADPRWTCDAGRCDVPSSCQRCSTRPSATAL